MYFYFYHTTTEEAPCGSVTVNEIDVNVTRIDPAKRGHPQTKRCEKKFSLLPPTQKAQKIRLIITTFWSMPLFRRPLVAIIVILASLSVFFHLWSASKHKRLSKQSFRDVPWGMKSVETTLSVENPSQKEVLYPYSYSTIETKFNLEIDRQVTLMLEEVLHWNHYLYWLKRTIIIQYDRLTS